MNDNDGSKNQTGKPGKTGQPAKPRKAATKPAAGKAAVGKQAAGTSEPGKAIKSKKPTRPAAKKSRAEPEPVAMAAIETSTSPAPTPCQLVAIPMPVRWRDLDAFNHVNNSKYLSYLEEARLQWMLGVPGQGMDDHVAPVVAAAQLNYRRPITWPAQLVIELFVERLGNTSLTVGHRIVDAEDDQVLYCDGNVVLVWIDRDSGQVAALPSSVREACSDR